MVLDREGSIYSYNILNIKEHVEIFAFSWDMVNFHSDLILNLISYQTDSIRSIPPFLQCRTTLKIIVSLNAFSEIIITVFVVYAIDLIVKGPGVFSDCRVNCHFSPLPKQTVLKNCTFGQCGKRNERKRTITEKQLRSFSLKWRATWLGC